MNKRGLFNLSKGGLILIVIVILIISTISYFIFHTKNCKTSGCFEAKVLNCKKAAIELKETSSISKYTIKGEKKGNCILHVKLKEAGGLSEEIREKFEGKEMICEIPKNEFSRMKIEDMGANLDYCHGPLKEEIYDVVIKKLYNLVIRDMSSVLEEVERTL